MARSYGDFRVEDPPREVAGNPVVADQLRTQLRMDGVVPGALEHPEEVALHLA